MYNLLIITKTGQQLYSRVSERDCKIHLKLALHLVEYRMVKI